MVVERGVGVKAKVVVEKVKEKVRGKRRGENRRRQLTKEAREGAADVLRAAREAS